MDHPSRSEIFNGVAKGAYILVSDAQPKVILMATGSEVQIALAARELLLAQGVDSRVVSMPCLEWFNKQSAGYKESVLPEAIGARVAVEAGATFGWYSFVGRQGSVVGLDHFGASASAPELFDQFELTPDAVVHAALETIARNT